MIDQAEAIHNGWHFTPLTWRDTNVMVSIRNFWNWYLGKDNV